MIIEMVSLLVAIVLPIATKVPLAIAMLKDNGYDNHHPRTQQARLVGFGARAKASHENAFEALILFAPVIVLAMSLNSLSMVTQYAAGVWIISRIFYHIAYAIDAPKWRSGCWVVSYGCTIVIMLSLLVRLV